MHHLPDHGIRIAEEQIPETHGTDQRPLIVQHITDIDRLTVQSDPADPLDGLRHRVVLLQIHILHRHDAARRVLRVPHQVIDGLPRLGIRVGDQPFYNIGRHLLHQFLGVVTHHVIDDVGRILVGKRRDDILLKLQFQTGKNIRRDILR